MSAEQQLPPQSTAAIAAALAKANLEIHNPSFDKLNPHFKSRFASLAAVRNAVVPLYAKHGLSIQQDLISSERGVSCYTHILHASGERLVFGPLTIAPSKNDAQGIGAAGTYAKRIALQGIACVVGDEDDDGEQAVGRPTGVTTLDPRGTPSAVDPAKVAQYVERFRAAADNPDDMAAAADVYAIHMEVSSDHDLYIAIGDALGSKYKNAIRRFVEMAKKRNAA